MTNETADREDEAGDEERKDAPEPEDEREADGSGVGSGDRQASTGSSDESPPERIVRETESSLKTLSAGPALSLMGGALPMRAVIAVGLFVAVFLVVYMLLWVVLGTFGLALGWIVALAAAAGSIKLLTDRYA